MRELFRLIMIILLQKNTVAYNEFLNLSSSQVRTMNATEEGQSKLDQLVNNEDINSIKYFS